MSWRHAVVAAALAIVLSGCVSNQPPPTTTAGPQPFSPDALSQKSFDIEAPVELWVPSSVDGKQLHNVVYLPKTEEKVPVFINFSPYWGDTATTKGDAFASYMIEEYVPRGYAVVLSAVRGTGHSEGCFQVGGDLELQDARDVIDAMAAAEWSTGMVAAGGKSYDSTTQNGVVAKFPTSNLKGIFHVSGITDMYRYNAKDGVVYGNGLSFTPRYAAGQGLDEYGATPVNSGGGSSQDEDAASLARLVDDAACPEMAEHIASGEGTAASGLKDAYWQERDWNAFLPDSTWNGTVFFVHGLQDWNVKPDNIDPWLDILQAKGIPVLGWLHQETENAGHLYPMRDDWNQTMLRWLDYTLKGKDTRMDTLWGIEVQGSDEVWRRSEAWPPQSTISAMEIANNDSMGGFLSVPAEGLRIVGSPTLTLNAATTSADAVLRAQMFRVNGTTTTWVNEAVARANLADDLSTPDPVPPGTTRGYVLTFYPMDLELAAGEKLAITLGFGPGDLATPDGLGTAPNFFVTAGQQLGTTYDATGGVFTVSYLDTQTHLGAQPVATRCFAC